MTNNRVNAHNDRSEDLELFVQAVLKTVQERLHREVRYCPQFNGKIVFTCHFKHGKPTAFKVETDDSQLVTNTRN